MTRFFLWLCFALLPFILHAQSVSEDSVIFAREQLAIITLRQEPQPSTQQAAPAAATPTTTQEDPRSTYPQSPLERREQLDAARPDLGKGASTRALWEQAKLEDQPIESAQPPASVPMKEVRRTYDFIITLHNAQTLSTNWIYDATDVHDEFGMLYVFDTPTTTTIEPSENQSSYDIVSISSYGEIRSIAKNIVPASLAEPLEVTAPIKALLYLEGGTTEKHDIRVRDKIYHPMFPDRPEVQEE